MHALAQRRNACPLVPWHRAVPLLASRPVGPTHAGVVWTDGTNDLKIGVHTSPGFSRWAAFARPFRAFRAPTRKVRFRKRIWPLQRQWTLGCHFDPAQLPPPARFVNACRRMSYPGAFLLAHAGGEFHHLATNTVHAYAFHAQPCAKAFIKKQE